MYTNILSAATALIAVTREIEGYHEEGGESYFASVHVGSSTVERIFKGLRRAVRADELSEDEEDDLGLMFSLRNTNLLAYVRGVDDEIVVETHSISLYEIIDCLTGVIDFILMDGDDD